MKVKKLTLDGQELAMLFQAFAKKIVRQTLQRRYSIKGWRY